ncbi:MAG: PAAR domain-containing protein [Gammaproteobacteria bacterium]|nr:PAAR domain-containing protein [Gammaproteobacteria bacterium]
MPPQSRKSDICIPEPCYPPSPVIEGSPDHFVNSLPVARVGDKIQVHCLGSSCHDSVVSGGSGTVFTNSKPRARVGDPIGCGEILAAGSFNTLTGD